MKRRTVNTKLFQEGAADLIRELGFDEEVLLQQQRVEYKKHVLNVLDAAKRAVENNDIVLLQSLTSFSPSGDGWGTDHSFLNFRLNDFSLSKADAVKRDRDGDEGVDILEAMDFIIKDTYHEVQSNLSE